MNKKKAIICTALFGIIMFTIVIVSSLIENEQGDTLFSHFSAIITGMWISEKTIKFYDWLRK